MATLAVGVAVRHPDTGAAVFLRAGSVPPEWARGRLGGHVFADGSAPSDATVPMPAPMPEPEPAPSGVPDPPPRYGRGSSAAVWREWADQAGIQAPEDASRDEVITAAVRAGVIADD